MTDNLGVVVLAPPMGFRVASKIKRRSISWMLDQRIPLAEVVALAGDGGTGKSTVAQELAARVSCGDLPRLPGGSDLGDARGVVILTTEEDPEAVLRPRLQAMGADLDRILILSDSGDEDCPPLTLPAGADRLEQAARFVDAALIVVDTGPGFLDPGMKSNSEEDVRRFYRPLARMARELRLVVLVIAHLNKGSDVARHRVTGSAAWVNVPRSVLILGPPPGDDPLETPERLMAVVKANLIGGKMPDAISMRLKSADDDPTVAVIAWTGEQAGVRASDLTATMDPDERGERQECEQAIQELLADGPKAAKTCEADLKRGGHSPRTIRRAREALFITRDSGCVYQAEFRGPFIWRLPTDDRAASVSNGATRVTPGPPVSAQMSTTHTDVHKETPRARDARGQVLHEEPGLLLKIEQDIS